LTENTSIREGLALLGDRNFSRLFYARLVSMFGTAMAPLAIAFGVLELTGSPVKMGIVIASQTTAQILVLLLGGALADRSSRQRQMVFADVLAMLAQFTMAALFLFGYAEVPILAALMAVNGVAMALHSPAEIGLVPQVVPVEKLQPANALLGAARSGALAMGAACAGLLVAAFGAGWALVVNAISFAASAILIWQLKPGQQIRGKVATLFQDLREGWHEFTSHRWLWTIVLQFALVVAAAESVFALIGPTVAKQMLGGAAVWGFIAASFGAGTLVGGFVAMRLSIKRPMFVATLLVFSFALPALCLAALAPVWIIALGCFIDGICGQIFAVLWYTTLQKQVAPEALSRVSAYDSLGSIGLAPMGVIAAGWLLEVYGFRPTLILAAVLIVLPTIAVLGVREVRTLRA
jgi:MFS family permease